MMCALGKERELEGTKQALNMMKGEKYPVVRMSKGNWRREIQGRSGEASK